jgi:uncharacterized protein YciI
MPHRVSAEVRSAILIAVRERLFVYLLECVARPSRQAIAAHVRYLRSLGDTLVIGGPYRDLEGSVVCVTVGDSEAADSIARADPLVAFGFTLYEVHEIDAVERIPAPAGLRPLDGP